MFDRSQFIAVFKAEPDGYIARYNTGQDDYGPIFSDVFGEGNTPSEAVSDLFMNHDPFAPNDEEN